MTNATYVTLVLEDALANNTQAQAEADLPEARARDAARLGASVRCFASAPLDPKADLAGFVSIFEHADASLDVSTLTGAGTSLRASASYRLRNVMPGSASACDAAGMLVGLTDCSDASELPEFNRWYDENHAADVIRSGKYQRGRRFEAESSELGHFLAIYETTGAEPETFKSYLAWPERDRSRCTSFVVRQVFTLRRIG